MKRRQFLSAASSIVAPVLLNGISVKAMAKDSLLVKSLQKNLAANDDRILVVIYLGGGNDGLNTVIPLNYYSDYYKLRSNIAIPESKVLKLPGFEETGLHPAMSGMHNLFSDGKLSIIHSVSYPNPNLSHFRSTDIWMTGVSSNEFSSTGWAGRYLEEQFPGYPTNYPNSTMEDPLAVQIGQISSTALLGSSQSMAIPIEDPNTFYQLIGEAGAQTTSNSLQGDARDLVSYIRDQQVMAVGFAGEIKSAADSGTNMASYPQGNELAEQLKIVARLIHGGLKSRIYYVELGGFDTHASQVATNSLEGVHNELLKKLSDGIVAFQNDLRLQGTEDRVLGMTFSDFGRRATSNASKGTDHGIAAPMFVFGTGIKRRMIGMNPDLVNGLLPENPNNWESNRDIKMQIDFRRVYYDVLQNWMGASTTSTNKILKRDFQTVSLFTDVVKSSGSGSWDNPEIWSSGRVPTVADKVIIQSGHAIEAKNIVRGSNIKVMNGGDLRFTGDFKVNNKV